MEQPLKPQTEAIFYKHNRDRTIQPPLCLMQAVADAVKLQNMLHNNKADVHRDFYTLQTANKIKCISNLTVLFSLGFHATLYTTQYT